MQKDKDVDEEPNVEPNEEPNEEPIQSTQQEEVNDVSNGYTLWGILLTAIVIVVFFGLGSH